MLSIKKILLTFLLFLFLPSNIFAEEPTPTPIPTSTPTPTSSTQNYNNVSLSEIYPNADEGQVEWIEIYNPDSNDLNGLIIKDKTGELQTLTSTTSTYVVIEITNKLNNDTDKVFISKPDGTNIDEYEYSSTEKNKSWSKVSGSWCKTETSKNSSNNSCYSEPTPTPTSTPESSEKISDIRINEIFPTPSDNGNEWVEIYNNNDFSVNLSGWQLKDSADNTRTINEIEVAGKSFVYYAFSSGFLNNDGDRIKLFDNENREIYAIPESYSLIAEDISWAYVDGSWCKANPSKGSANSTCLTEDDEEDSKDEDEDAEEEETPKPKKSEDKDSEDMLLEKDRDLPEINKQDKEASVAGVTTEQQEKPKKKMTIPIIIASVGFVIMLGASYPFLKPKLIPFFAKLKRKKKD